MTDWTTDWITLLNVLLAVLVGLAAFGMLNKMRWGVTKPCIAGAALLILLGAVGTALGAAFEDWQPYADSMLLAGVAALLLGTQRVPRWIGERLANPLASVIVAAGFLAFTLAVALPARAQAPAQAPATGPVRMDCQYLAKAISSAMIFRDVGADLKKLEAYVRAQVGAGSPQLEATLREVRRMWSTTLPPEEAAFAAYQRCTRQLGDMGREG